MQRLSQNRHNRQRHSAANERRESRGNHYREDYPEQDDATQLRCILVKKGNDGNVVTEDYIRDPAWKSREGDMNGLSWG